MNFASPSSGYSYNAGLGISCCRPLLSESILAGNFRYLYQLRFLNFSGIEIRYRQATYNVRPSAVTEGLPADISLGIRKTPEIMADVERLRDRSRLDTNALSASSLKLYINCPLAFYLEHVAEIKVPDPFKTLYVACRYRISIPEKLRKRN